MKRIVCMGGGPAGLYSAILFKRRCPSKRRGFRAVAIVRTTLRAAVWWFSDKTCGNFLGGGCSFACRIAMSVIMGRSQCATQGTNHPLERSWIRGSISRRMRSIPAEASGVPGRESQRFKSSSTIPAVRRRGSGGECTKAQNSKATRAASREMRSRIEVSSCRYIWLRYDAKFSAFTFASRKRIRMFRLTPTNSAGTLDGLVETREETWAAHGLDKVRYRPVMRIFARAVAAYRRQFAAAVQRAHLRVQQGSISTAWYAGIGTTAPACSSEMPRHTRNSRSAPGTKLAEWKTTYRGYGITGDSRDKEVTKIVLRVLTDPQARQRRGENRLAK